MRMFVALALLVAGCGEAAETERAADEGITREESAPDVPVAPLTPPQALPSPVQPRLPLEPASQGPSFRCAGALSEAQRIVCSDPELAALDREMARAHAEALEGAPPAEREALAEKQRDALSRRERCTTADCIAQAYRSY